MGTRGPCGLLCAAALLVNAAHAAETPCAPWPEWQAFKRLYLTEDGRVVDAGTAQSVTVSEGQAYALTFALIANDRAGFERVLSWTGDNLAGGDLARALPAWKWGRTEDGKWGILDRNSAADADLWIAYALLEAAGLWHEAAYAELARKVSALILRDEVALIPGLGATLLPGPRGFVTEQTWRLSASYVPLQVLRALQRQGDAALWTSVIDSAQRVIVGSAPRGYAADWILYREDHGFAADAATHGVGSYNAIRVYLWAGMLNADDPLGERLAQQLKPMASAAAQHAPPESVDTDSLASSGQGPVGFAAAVLPLLVHFRLTDTVQSYRKRIDAESLRDNQHYYSDALTLFGLGWLEGRYRFDRHGELRVRWSGSCRVD
jgi:endo-1,4-beta-D-glucanase Y